MLKLDRGLFVQASALSLAVLSLVACRGDEADTSASGSSTGGAEDSNSSTGAVVPTTSESAGDSTTGDVDDSTTTGVTPTTDESAGFITTATTTNDTNNDPLPNGSQCSSDDECASMNCFSLLGGMVAFCADCNEDQDCVDAGTGTACSLDVMGQNAICTTGELGSTCMSDEACADGKCGPVIEIPIPGIIPDLCNECDASADCTDGKLCSPVFDLMMFSGQKSCVEPGSVMNNNLCPKGPDGPMVCMSGHCNSATIMGIVEVFVCGECDSDADCEPNQTCTPAEASMSGFTGSVCS